jgi:hypothetical protein
VSMTFGLVYFHFPYFFLILGMVLNQLIDKLKHHTL